jgi:hypothetical protein
MWMTVMHGSSIAVGSNANDSVKAGTEGYPDRAFGDVTEWSADGGGAKIRLSDGSVWTLSGAERVATNQALLDWSKTFREPIYLAVDGKSREVGMIFTTAKGEPTLDGETADGTRLRVHVPPSARVFSLRKDRPWFDRVKAAIVNSRNPATAMPASKQCVAYDSVTGEIVEVRPASPKRP